MREEFKVCNKCGVSKPIKSFSLASKTTEKRRHTCNSCKNKDYHGGQRDREIAAAQASRRTVEDLIANNIALPRTFVRMDEYVPEKGYYRNDGNKHIQSRGI